MAIKRLYDTLIGATVNVNQLVDADTTSVTIQSGHKYYAVIGGTRTIANSTGTAISVTGGTDIITDLTAFFDTTIADYIYSLETATAGAGVAKLKEWGFLKGYQAYNAGSIESVEVTGKVVRGFNQFDASNITPNSTINSSGAVIAGLYNVSDYIKILPNTTYFARSVIRGNDGRCFCVYDENKTFITSLVPEYPEGTVNHYVNNAYFTMPNNARYAKIITATPNTCCINLSSDRNGEYEPYSAHTYDLGTDTLRGLFKLDSNNNLYADGDRKASDGTVTRKYGVVDLGTLDWINAGGLKMFYTMDVTSFIRKAASSSEVFSWGVTSNGMTRTNYDKIGTNTPYNICVSTSGSVLATLNTDTAYSSSDAFKTAMSGVYLVYELATPTTEQSTPFTNPQICDPDGTEEYVTSNGVPVGHETRYQL